MTLLFHLSDLHLREAGVAQGILLDKLVEALGRERTSSGSAHVAVVITGDLFDSAPDAPKLVGAFIELHERILGVLGRDAPTVVLPGNHDRRRLGVVGPHLEGPFLALARAVHGRRIFVAGTRTPFLAQLVPADLHGMEAHVVAYDSTYLPDGLLGAGGTLRLEDLLQVHSLLPKDDKPLILLMHHHLIPTPVTDVSGLENDRAPRLARWLLRVAVPALVSNGDREELTMTALGAGTALSALHSFGRPVLLLHGHKHVPTGRLLRGMTPGCGDLLLASAGTAGRRERVHATRHPDAARLWPSFNVLQLGAEEVRVEAVSFFPKSSTRPSLRRQLAHVRRAGPKWELESGSFRVSDPAPRVHRDEANFVLSPSTSRPERWDVACERSVALMPGAALRRYVDFVRFLPAKQERRRRKGRPSRRVDLHTSGTTRYGLSDALCRTLGEASRSYGAGTAFEWVGLLCRYGAERAVVGLSKTNMVGVVPFASFTDLTVGRERPLDLVETPTHWTALADGCPPRSMLRIYWPLSAE